MSKNDLALGSHQGNVKVMRNERSYDHEKYIQTFPG
jgi:hypothetical protein